MRQPPNHRRAVIHGLRQLADELSQNRDIPVPLVIEVSYHPRGETDAEKHAEVDRIAKVLGVIPEFAAGAEHYRAVRRFGAVEYRAVTVSTKDLAQWEALMSYWPHFMPHDENTEADQ